MKLNGKIALITGGKNPVNLESAQKMLGPNAVVVSADAASLADAEKVANEIQQRFGKLDIAFLNAGIAEFAPISDSAEAFYDKLFDVTVKGLFFQFQKLLPLLGKGSSVILNSSIVISRACREPASAQPPKRPSARSAERSPVNLSAQASE